jgi:hypothetical protein
VTSASRRAGKSVVRVAHARLIRTSSLALQVLWFDHMPRTPLLLVAALAACGDSDEGPRDIVGPFTGPTHRFVVDTFEFPRTTTEARKLGGDLDGNGTADNQLGALVATLYSNGNVTPYGKDMIAAGTVRLTVEITADDLVDDPTVGVKLIGHDPASVIEVGGTLVDGKFLSNRTATTAVPGKSTLVLPVFVDADPSVLPLEHVQLELTLVDGELTGLVQGAADPRVVADGRCAPPSCSDNLRDGFESDVDCGGACAGCALGLRCYFNSDCASGQCGPPCPEGEICPPTDEICDVAP